MTDTTAWLQDQPHEIIERDGNTETLYLPQHMQRAFPVREDRRFRQLEFQSFGGQTGLNQNLHDDAG